MTEIRHEITLSNALPWPDFVVISKHNDDAFYVELDVFEVIGTDGTEDGSPLLFHSKGWVSSPADSTTDITAAEVYIGGSIKWDGCSNWDFGGVNHFCGRSSAMAIGVLMDRLYSIALEAMGGHAADVGMYNGE